MISFTLFYISFFIIAFLFVPKCVNNNSQINCELDLHKYVLLCLCLLLYFGFGLFGYDTKNYYWFYQSTKPLYFFSIFDYKKEHLFYLLMSICKTFGLNYAWFRFINMLLDLILLYNVFNLFLEKKLWSFAFIIFFLFGGMNFSIDFIRNGKSLLFLMIAINYLNENNYKKFIFYSICSFLFHITSIFLVASCFITKIFLNKKFVLFLFCIGFVMGVTGYGLGKVLLPLIQKIFFGELGSLINDYANDSWTVAHGFSFGMIERIISFYIVYKYQDMLLKDYKCSKYFITFMYIHIFICFYFLDFTIIYERLASLYKISYWVLFPQIFNYQSGKKKNYIYVILFFYGLLKVYNNFNHEVYLPNGFILENGF
ncbi:MAG: EpsG family protein [Treponema sp.]|nr:EpsG family protein [Treponema sp.]MCI7567552.1 EpsG family protein [Treponema sp.]